MEKIILKAETRPGAGKRVAKDLRNKGFIPANLNTKIVDDVIKIANNDAFVMARRLAKEEGILCGISSGANVWAAIQYAQRPENKGKVIVTVACSTGERYLSTALADEARGQA